MPCTLYHAPACCFLIYTAAAHQEQQILDGKQEIACIAGKERHEGYTASARQ